MALLSVSNLSKRFGGLTANSDISFNVAEQSIVGIIGPNGAGKTTCFNLLSGFLPPTDGEVIFSGTNITKLNAHQTASLGMVRTFQHTSVFSELSVLDNILTGQHLEVKGLLKLAFMNRKKYVEKQDKMKEKAIEILNLMELEDKKDMIAKSLPYGEQRKLEIAIALAANPKLLLLDEPAAGMNETESAKLVQIIRKLKDKGLSILIVEHDMKVVMNLCDYIVVLDQGTKIAEGTPKEISTNPKVIEVYLGTPDEDHHIEEEGSVEYA
ncbi:ABC transporter ATP-binding protein [Neobacillus cucumis]|uniref:ABC transporter ATP-binding protein n=1 Tax=Neobacillus cucumis TaxID=1740721 RepID=UPI0018E050B0|nr:ABC transporter ATP-binding protein [Neobacillus cucumis]MBI0579217.1 ABC transporter ATP-binding protein [Neobacillus cucumis]